MRRVIFFVRRIGPYHHARFQEACKYVDLTVVETRSASTEYAWDFEGEGSYRRDRFPHAADPDAGLHGRAVKDAVADTFRKYKADVVVTTGWADQEYHAVVLEAAKWGLPRIVISDSRYEDEPRKFYKEQLKKWILKSYSAALVAGTAASKYLLQLGFFPDRIFHPWDVVDNDYFHVDHRQTAFRDRYFLCVSRFIEKKNLQTLINAFASYVKQGGKRKLVLLGSGELEGEIRSNIREQSIDTQVEMPGFAQYADLKEYYSNAFCLILPSASDQWGLVVNEGMAAGLPIVVSSNCGCVHDLVNVSANGFIFSPFNTGELVSVLTKMEEMDEATWNEMSKKSMSIIDNWGLPQFAKALAQAAEYAVTHGRTGSVSLIHKILAR